MDDQDKCIDHFLLLAIEILLYDNKWLCSHLMFTFSRSETNANSDIMCEWTLRIAIVHAIIRLRVRLHWASALMLRQLCDDATDSVLIENNGDVWKWVATPLWSVITELTLGVAEQGRSIAFYSKWCRCDNRRCVADAWCKRALKALLHWPTPTQMHSYCQCRNL